MPGRRYGSPRLLAARHRRYSLEFRRPWPRKLHRSRATARRRPPRPRRPRPRPPAPRPLPAPSPPTRARSTPSLRGRSGSGTIRERGILSAPGILVVPSYRGSRITAAAVAPSGRWPAATQPTPMLSRRLSPNLSIRLLDLAISGSLPVLDVRRSGPRQDLLCSHRTCSIGAATGLHRPLPVGDDPQGCATIISPVRGSRLLPYR